MINLILDTNVYRRDIERNTAAFQTLEWLIRQKLIRLHIPNFIEREFVSQLSIYYMQCYEDIIKNLNKLSEIKFLDSKTVETLVSNFFDKNKILEKSRAHFLDWLNQVDARKYALGLENYQTTFNDYFEGKPPFKGVKRRVDIPDSLVFQNIKQICENESDVHFISEDKDFLKACGEFFPKLKVYSLLEVFIQSETCKPLLNNSDESIILDYCRRNTSDLTGIFSQIVPNFLSGKIIESHRIPDDNHEARIISAMEPDSVDYKFDSAIYYGQGVLVIPASFKTDVEVYYYLYKPDYAAMVEVLSVSDHSEHYYEVSQNYEVFVEAAVRFEFEIIKEDDVSEVELKSSGVDSLISIEVL